MISDCVDIRGNSDSCVYETEISYKGVLVNPERGWRLQQCKQTGACFILSDWSSEMNNCE